MSYKVFYSGDVNVEHGGVFYTLEGAKWGYVDAARVVPCSDAGGPDNCFWVDVLTVNIESAAHKHLALNYCGVSLADFNQWDDKTKLHATIEALVSHGAYDQESSTMVRIGKPDEYYGGREEFNPSRTFQHNASLRNIARRALRAGGVY
jgi:hypothetical protein